MRPLVCSLALVAAATASTTTASAEPKRLTLEQLTSKAIAGPRGRMADGDIDAAAARVQEADAARYPRFKATAFGTISPEIRCKDPACTITDPVNFSLQFKGLFGSGQLEITQPLFTFGKITHARRAARAGLDAQRALANETAGDVAVEAARAYWGLKTAREVVSMLEDGIQEIDKAVAAMNEQTGSNKPSIQDRQRVAVLLAEARAQQADAIANVEQALAGVRVLANARDADIDEETMEPISGEPPGSLSGERRPQAIAARHGAIAADELAALQRAYYLPDFAVVASGVAAGAQGADDPPSAFANDPYNRFGAGAVVALQWNSEPWTLRARSARAAAEARKAHALADLAVQGAAFDADNAVADARAAHAKMTAAHDGEKAGRAWVASVLQGQAIGVVEARDLADAYIAWFQMHARWLQAVFQWNVAVVRLQRASGEFRAIGYRP
ncbi:MAG: TolC family protein [Deltaproteobacteria bacterium]|nr:TolC family protein [Deltaproteobacteria bacterium]MCW5805770.1 TolC family protein [Deltaproteobacteria bacterium]